MCDKSRRDEKILENVVARIKEEGQPEKEAPKDLSWSDAPNVWLSRPSLSRLIHTRKRIN